MRALGLPIVTCLALAATTNAQFSVSGPGDLIPNTGTGSSAGWDSANLDHDFTLTEPPGISSIHVPVPVTSIDSVVIQGLTHSWMGDTLCVLWDPNGVGYNIFLRPEIEVGETCCGNSGDFLGGTYRFVEPGTSANGPLPQTGDAAPGAWDQSWQSWDVVNNLVWPEPDENVYNVPLSGITGPAGIWTLTIYDWAAGDPGSFAGWTLNGNGYGGGATTYFEDFDAYPIGALEGNTNPSGAPWAGWGGNSYISQVVDTQAASAPHSALLPYGTDTVVDFDDMTGGNPMVSGQWRMTAEIFVTGDYDGEMFFIVMNEFAPTAGLYEWAIQVAMDGINGTMDCDCGTAGAQSAPLVVDEWVPLHWDIDLDADNVDFYYNGILIASYVWSGGVFGGDNYASLQIDAIDLYPNTAETVGEVYLDNIRITDISTDGPGVAYCPGDSACPCGNNNDGSMSGCDWQNAAGGAAGADLSATGTNVTADNNTFLMANNVSGDFGLFFAANGEVTGRTLSDGMRCAGHGLIRMTPPAASGGSTDTHAEPLQILDPLAAPGITRYYQYWFRTDPGACGGLANTTNGYVIYWL